MEVCYRYDGSFAGFLCCVFESYVHREWAAGFLTFDDPNFTLWEEREVETDPAHAQRVRRGVERKTSPAFVHKLERAHLTCMPDRDMVLYGLIRRALDEGKRVEGDLADPAMAQMTLALQKLWTEEDHLKGFVRFSQLDGVLVGEIEPKNRVLPLLAPHFAARLNGERMALYDRTHREAFFYENFHWAILPVEEFHMGPAGAEERQWRALWRRFYQAVTIQGRENLRCQDTHMPKRYRHLMTEFQGEEEAGLPAMGE